MELPELCIWTALTNRGVTEKELGHGVVDCSGALSLASDPSLEGRGSPWFLAVRAQTAGLRDGAVIFGMSQCMLRLDPSEE
jgi:hypothetical protein